MPRCPRHGPCCVRPPPVWGRRRYATWPRWPGMSRNAPGAGITAMVSPVSRPEAASASRSMARINNTRSLVGVRALASIPLIWLRRWSRCNATFEVTGPGGQRRMAAAEFFVLPSQNPARENALAATELLTGVRIPTPAAGVVSTYLKITDREAWTHAEVSVAVVLHVEGDAHTHSQRGVGRRRADSVAPDRRRTVAARDIPVRCRGRPGRSPGDGPRATAGQEWPQGPHDQRGCRARAAASGPGVSCRLRQMEARTTKGGEHACSRHYGPRRPGGAGSRRSARSPRRPRPGARSYTRGGGEPHGHDGTERLTGRAAEGGPTALRAGHGRGRDRRRGRRRCLHGCAGWGRGHGHGGPEGQPRGLPRTDRPGGASGGPCSGRHHARRGVHAAHERPHGPSVARPARTVCQGRRSR